MTEHVSPPYKLPDEVEEALDRLIDQVIDSYQNGLLSNALRLSKRVEVTARGGARLSIARAIRDAEERMRDDCADKLDELLQRADGAEFDADAMVDEIRSLPLENA